MWYFNIGYAQKKNYDKYVDCFYTFLCKNKFKAGTENTMNQEVILFVENLKGHN